MSDFDPSKFITYEQGVQRFNDVLKQVGLDMSKQIVTSKDPAVKKACDLLRVSNVPQGFNKWQLPFTVEQSTSFISSAAPNVSVAEHKHPGVGVRVIISGSIFYNGIELTAGDWMHMPANSPYSFKTGEQGVTMFYCYNAECCA